MQKNPLFLFLTLLVFAFPCFGYKELTSDKNYIFEVYEPSDSIPESILEEGHCIYFEAYLHPKLHEGVPFEVLGFDLSHFPSYEAFIADMFARDFASYSSLQASIRYYFQIRQAANDQIVGLAVVLQQPERGYYYLDHIGVHKDFRRLGLAKRILQYIKDVLSDFEEISLDTRVFNLPAQSLYLKCNFIRIDPHPVPSKRLNYFHYICKPCSLSE